MGSDLTGLADDELIARLLAGEADAFPTLVGRYQASLVRLAGHFVRDAASAEDVVQDTWMGLIRGIERFEGRATFRTWLFQILANRARSRAVREARYVTLEQDDDVSPLDQQFDAAGRWRVPPREWRVTPERALLSAEIRRLVEEAMAGLPPGQRAVVDLRDVQGLEADEVCSVLGLTETNQRVLLHRGRVRLRAVLAARLEL
jgi:RNA polymerase sigma-70 factor (ECF subfamily)